MSRILRYTAAGTLGAIIAWAIIEATGLVPSSPREPSYMANFLIGVLSGLWIGLLLGLAEAAGGMSIRDARRSVIAGALVGAAGGVLGLSFGNAFYGMVRGIAGPGPGEAAPGPLWFLLLLIGRGVGWALLGGVIGLSQGLATGSTKKMINGMIGGFLGGGLGGAVFEILVWMNSGGFAIFLPWMIRLISFSLTGGAIGLFVGFIEEVTKKAWLMRLVGRNEGKEYTIFKKTTLLGRSETADIAVFGDPDVAERHAMITAQGNRHVIEDLGSFAGTSVNGTKIAKDTLSDGDTIVIGKTRFLFKDKATARYTQGSPSTAPSIPTSRHICRYCGAFKDVNGNCDCTVGASTANPASGQTPGAQPTVQPGFFQPGRAAGPLQPAAGGDRGAKLTAISGPESGRVFVLKPETQVGRESTKDIPLPADNTVSRYHARVVQEGAGYVLYDMGSTNGTYVNGTRVNRQELGNSDVVQIGNTRFKFEN